MHDAYLAHAALIVPPEPKKPDIEATFRAILPVTPSSWERAFRLAGLDETYEQVIAATERAHRAMILGIWRQHPAGRLYAAFQHMAAIAATPPGQPCPVHADPEIERLADLNPNEMVDELVARGFAGDPPVDSRERRRAPCQGAFRTETRGRGRRSRACAISLGDHSSDDAEFRQSERLECRCPETARTL